MTQANTLASFRSALSKSASIETIDTGPLLQWLNGRREGATFSSHLIPLREARAWHIDDDTGNVVHESGEFFAVEAVRTTSSNLREVNTWDQPIFTQKEGGVLALLAKIDDSVVYFLLAAKAEPGNIGQLQFAPTIQATWSNLNRAHQGARPRYSEVLLGEHPGTLIYRSYHNEEGGRFWKKSNSNEIHLIDTAQRELEVDANQFAWATLSQIKSLCLIDNIINPFVKTIIAPL